MIYMVLGMVFESLSMLLLTVPIFFPLVQSLGFDPVWFGIVVVKRLSRSGPRAKRRWRRSRR
jgi:TRAP-type C4-dicarboxylate transport system permease large subunit